MRYLFSVLLAFIAVAAKANGPSTSAEVVERFFPAELREEGTDRPEAAYQSAYVEFAPRSSKERHLVAAYTNGSNGLVRVLTLRNGQWTLTTELEVHESVSMPDIDLIDLDGDKIPEVLAHFKAGGQAWDRDWIYRWDGTSLRAMVPEAAGNGTGSVSIVETADLDGDGILDIVDEQQYQDACTCDDCDCDMTVKQRYSVYGISEGAFVQRQRLTFFATVPIVKKLPIVRSYEGVQGSTDGPHVLRVVAAGDKGQWNIKNLEIRINGTIVADGLQLSASKPFVVLPVSLLAENTIDVRVNVVDEGRGAPSDPKDRRLVLAIEQR